MKMYRLTLKTLSPVCVGAGDEHQRSPLMEYVYEDGQVHYVHAERLNDLLLKDPSLMDEFVEQVRQRTGHTEREDGRHLRRFLEHRLGVNLANVVAFSTPAIGRISGLIRATVKNGLQPYIPGSTIKGAIRTAVLVSLLLEKPDHPVWKQFVQNIQNRNYRSLARDLEIDVFQIPRNKRGYPIIEKDPFRQLSVSDTEPFSAETLQVGTVGRYKLALPDGTFLRDPQHLMNIPWEMIPDGVTTTLTFGLGKDNRLDFLQKGVLEPLFKRINDVSYALIARELDVIDTIESPSLTKIADFYTSLDRQLKNATTQEAFLRLGHAKTYFDQTIGIVAEEEDDEGHFLLELIQRLGLTRRAKELQDPLAFPRTRSFLCDEDMRILAPIGWVHLTWETA